MRSVLNADQFTFFGLWIRQFCRKSHDGLSVTNLDYIFEDFHNRRLMLVEEKQNGGSLGHAQRLTFYVLDKLCSIEAAKQGYDYWGFYLVKMPPGCTMIGPGMTLNNHVVTVEELRDHLDFKEKFCDGWFGATIKEA